MRAIQKYEEPPALAEHRRKSGATYANFPDKDVLRAALVSEQRGLCCGNRDLSRNPAEPAHAVEALVSYLGDGTIESGDRSFQTELESILNLNTSSLVNNRKAVLAAFQRMLEKRSVLRVPTVERLLLQWSGESHRDQLEPYCGVVIYYLRKRLRRGAPAKT